MGRFLSTDAAILRLPIRAFVGYSFAVPFCLVVLSGVPSDLGRVFRLKEGTFLIGRAEGADIRLDTITVSRRHARLIVEPSRVSIEDAGSTSGIYINDERALGVVPLVPPVKFTLGGVLFKLLDVPDEEAGARRGCL